MIFFIFFQLLKNVKPFLVCEPYKLGSGLDLAHTPFCQSLVLDEWLVLSPGSPPEIAEELLKDPDT